MFHGVRMLRYAIFNSFSNLLYLDNSRAETSACKPNVKLFHLLGSSSLHVNSPNSGQMKYHQVFFTVESKSDFVFFFYDNLGTIGVQDWNGSDALRL